MVEDVFITHVMGIMQSDATLPPWLETEVPEVRRTKGHMSTVTPGVMVIGPRSVSVLSTSTTAGEVIPVERPQQEGSPMHGASAEPPWTLI
jgi:hypothetical protein